MAGIETASFPVGPPQLPLGRLTVSTIGSGVVAVEQTQTLAFATHPE
jgi:hypothetical protein